LRNGLISKNELLLAIKNDPLFPESVFGAELKDMEIFQNARKYSEIGGILVIFKGVRASRHRQRNEPRLCSCKHSGEDA
jgi:hypothetical protein